MKDKITEILNKGVKKDFPGGQYCIVYKDKIVCDYVGYKSYDPLVLNKGNEIYDVASLTKVISTTTLIMKLIEEDKLSLETKVVDILTDFKHEDITIYDLLIHSSGLPPDVSRSYTLKSREDVLERVFNANKTYEKYTKVIYTDIGYMILGLIIEKLYDKPIDIAAKKTIFEPLKMNNTSYRPNAYLCAPTEFREDEVFKGYLRGMVHDEKAFAMDGLAGHAGLFSTAKDIGLFIQSILNENFVLSKDTVSTMFESRITKEGRYGLTSRSYGWEKPTDDINKIISHTGFTGCNMWIDLNLNIGFVLLTNGVHPKREDNNIFPYRREIRELFLNTIKDEV